MARLCQADTPSEKILLCAQNCSHTEKLQKAGEVGRSGVGPGARCWGQEVAGNKPRIP